MFPELQFCGKSGRCGSCVWPQHGVVAPLPWDVHGLGNMGELAPVDTVAAAGSQPTKEGCCNDHPGYRVHAAMRRASYADRGTRGSQHPAHLPAVGNLLLTALTCSTLRNWLSGLRRHGWLLLYWKLERIIVERMHANIYKGLSPKFHYYWILLK